MVESFHQMRQGHPYAFFVFPRFQSQDEKETQALLCSRFPLLGDLLLIPYAVASGLFSDAPSGTRRGGIRQQIGTKVQLT